MPCISAQKLPSIEQLVPRYHALAKKLSCPHSFTTFPLTETFPVKARAIRVTTGSRKDKAKAGLEDPCSGRLTCIPRMTMFVSSASPAALDELLADDAVLWTDHSGLGSLLLLREDLLLGTLTCSGTCFVFLVVPVWGSSCLDFCRLCLARLRRC
jgi:hypothetical protein